MIGFSKCTCFRSKRPGPTVAGDGALYAEYHPVNCTKYLAIREMFLLTSIVQQKVTLILLNKDQQTNELTNKHQGGACVCIAAIQNAPKRNSNHSCWYEKEASSQTVICGSSGCLYFYLISCMINLFDFFFRHLVTLFYRNVITFHKYSIS